MLEQDKGMLDAQMSDSWTWAAIEGSWANEDENMDDDDIHDLWLFGA